MSPIFRIDVITLGLLKLYYSSRGGNYLNLDWVRAEASDSLLPYLQMALGLNCTSVNQMS